jgi:hypothetical protein
MTSAGDDYRAGLAELELTQLTIGRERKSSSNDVLQP